MPNKHDIDRLAILREEATAAYDVWMEESARVAGATDERSRAEAEISARKAFSNFSAKQSAYDEALASSASNSAEEE